MTIFRSKTSPSRLTSDQARDGGRHGLSRCPSPGVTDRSRTPENTSHCRRRSPERRTRRSVDGDLVAVGHVVEGFPGHGRTADHARVVFVLHAVPRSSNSGSSFGCQRGCPDMRNPGRSLARGFSLSGQAGEPRRTRTYNRLIKSW